ncbi:MAG: protein YgfX [bacterium]
MPSLAEQLSAPTAPSGFSLGQSTSGYLILAIFSLAGASLLFAMPLGIFPKIALFALLLAGCIVGIREMRDLATVSLRRTQGNWELQRSGVTSRKMTLVRYLDLPGLLVLVFRGESGRKTVRVFRDSLSDADWRSLRYQVFNP